MPLYSRMLIPLLLIAVLASACQSRSNGYEVVYAMDSETTSGPADSADPGAGRSYTIAFVPKGSDIPYFQYAAEGAMEAGRELGVNVLYSGPPEADADRQIEVIRRLIEQKVDLIAVSANDPVKLVPVLEDARKRGVRVITWDADTEPEARKFFVNMVEPETLGRHLMDTLALAMGEKGDFAVLTGSLSAANLNEWLKWIKRQQVEFYPDMRLVEVAATDDDLRKAAGEARRLLAQYPNLQGILGNSSVGPPAAAKEVRAAGKAGKVKVVGLSNPKLMKEYLLDDSAQMATLWSPKKLGYLTVVLAVDYLRGRLPKDGQVVDNVGNIRVSGDMVVMGEPLDFTKENVDQYDF